jgi:hypothetical protein
MPHSQPAPDYPALFTAAEGAAREAQRAHLACIFGFSLFSMAGAGLAAWGVEYRTAAVTGAVLFLAALSLSVLMAVRRFESTWYWARAVAESVKTMTWRFMMRAEPFTDDVAVPARARFRSFLREILAEHRDLAHELSGMAEEREQITTTMNGVRDLEFVDRLAYYRKHRVEEQRAWYARKAASNRRSGTGWFLAIVGLQAGAVFFTVMRVAIPAERFWPIEIFVVAASSVLAWTQANRFRELAASYGLTAHEIGLAHSELNDISGSEGLSRFVADTENVFSREHNRWVVRKK